MRTRLSAAVLALAFVLAACGSSSTPAGDAAPVFSAPSTIARPTTTLPPGCGVPASKSVSYTATAINTGELPIYEAPGAPEPVRTMTNPRLINDDPNAPVDLVFLVKDAPVADDCGWVEVYLPMRPNGSSGWVKRSDVTLAANPYRIEANLGAFTLTVFEGGNILKEIPIAVAADNTPTPGGLYYITELVQTPNPDGVYGPYAYGLSGFSEVHQTFNGGPGQLGIHGTNQPQFIGQEVSNGCIRMRNEDITALSKILPLGVPVEVIA
jgi:lipoprotein-anchoring transpeptidase ErfK/SrfK